MKMKQLMAAALVALLGVFSASAADPAQALQGKVAGVNVTSGSGAPGSGAQIRIRGAATFEDGAIFYLDWDGKKMTNAVCTAYEIVSNQTTFAAGETYVVEDDVTIEDAITVEGTAANPTKLILCDYGTLTAEKGIVVNEGSALIIYGQEDCTGLLMAEGDSNCAGIGSSGQDFKDCGSITINGGTIEATGNGGAAGIGGGDSLGAGVITINGGNVIAQGGSNGGKFGMAIGDGEGYRDAPSTLTLGSKFYVYAGTNAVTATNVTMEAYLKDHSAPYALLGYVHEHVWGAPEEVNDYTVLSECLNPAQCPEIWGVSFYIGADDFGETAELTKDYDGKPFTAKLIGFENFTNTTGFAMVDSGIIYTTAEGDELAGAPVEPGDYIAFAPVTLNPGDKDEFFFFLKRDITILPPGGDVVYPKVAKSASSTGILKAPGTATWKAKAYAGYVFAGWEWIGDPEKIPNSFTALSENERKNPTLKLKLGAGAEVRPTYIKATWALISDDGNMELNFLSPEDVYGARALSFKTKSQVTATVKGLPKGLKYDKKSLKISISDSKKLTEEKYDVFVTAKNASGYVNNGTKLTIFLSEDRSRIEASSTMSDQDVEGFPVSVWGGVNGTAKLSKVYLPTYDAKGNPKTKAAFSAKPNKDYVFAGWWLDAEYTNPAWWPESPDYRAASRSIPLTTNLVAEGKLELFAKFITKAVYDKESGEWIGEDVVTNVQFQGWFKEPLRPGETNTWYQGVRVPAYMGISTFDSQTACSVSVSGLPSGVKFDKDTYGFTGVPTKAGLFPVTFTFKNASGPQKFVLMVEVEELPCWAIGTFDGYHMEDGKTNGTFTATIGKTGKVNGKTAGGVADTKFSAPCFSEVVHFDTFDVYYLDTTVKYKDPVSKKTVTTNNTVYLVQDIKTGLGLLGGGDKDGCGVVSYQNAWKNLCIAQPSFPKAGIEVEGLPLGPELDLTLKIGAKGVVTVTGTVGADRVKATSKSQLLLVGYDITNDFYYAKACVYVPKAKFCQVYDIKLTVDDDLLVTKAEIGAMPSDSKYALTELNITEKMISGRVALRPEAAMAFGLSTFGYAVPREVELYYQDAQTGVPGTFRVQVAADGTFALSVDELGENIRFVKDAAAGADEVIAGADGLFKAPYIQPYLYITLITILIIPPM